MGLQPRLLSRSISGMTSDQIIAQLPSLLETSRVLLHSIAELPALPVALAETAAVLKTKVETLESHLRELLPESV